MSSIKLFIVHCIHRSGGLVAEWLACWTQTQKGPGSNRSCDAGRVTVLGDIFRVAGVTASLVESNGSLLSGLWLTPPAGWLPGTGISSVTLCSVIECGLHLRFYTQVSVPQYHVLCDITGRAVGNAVLRSCHTDQPGIRRRTQQPGVDTQGCRQHPRGHHVVPHSTETETRFPRRLMQPRPLPSGCPPPPQSFWSSFVE